MRKLNFILGLCLTVLFVSCNKDDPEDPDRDGYWIRGVHKFVIEQSGDIEDFLVGGDFGGGDGVSSGIFAEGSNKDLGMSYYLTNEENKRNTYVYNTAENGIMLIFTYTAVPNPLSEGGKSLTIKATGYINDKKVVEKSHTYYSTDTEVYVFQVVTDDKYLKD